VDGAPRPADPDEAIRESEDAIGILEADLTVVDWNAAAVRLYGIPAADLIGMNLRDILRVERPGHHDVVGTLVRPALARSGFWNGRVIEHVLIGPRAGTPLIVDVTAIVVHDPAAGPPRMLVTNRDVTASARLEDEMAALASLVTATGGARTVPEVGVAALDILCRATGADSALVASSDGVFEPIATVGASPATMELLRSLGGPGEDTTRLLQAPEAFISADVADAPLRPEVRAALLADGLRHVVGVGLHVPGRLIGGLALGWREVPRNGPSKGVLLQAAALIAAAIENARLIALIESGLAEERLLTRRMRALVELTRLPTVSPAGEHPLEGLLAEVDAVIGATGSVLCEVDGDFLRPVAVANLEIDRIAALLDIPLSRLPLASRLGSERVSLLLSLDDAGVTAPARVELGRQAYRSIAAFAIREDERLVAIVYAGFVESIDELELDQRTLDAIGRVLDISFANRRLRVGAVASELRYRELFEGSPDAIVVESADGRVVDANPAALRLYGEGLVGQQATDLIAGDDRRTTVDQEGVTHAAGTGRRLDGSTFPEEIDIRSIEIGGETRTLAIVRDLTESSRLQAELVQAQKMEAIGLLVAGVAHELNNPLASIVAFSQLIRTDPNLPPDLRAQAELLVQEADRTRSIVGNLLDFARQRPPERVELALRPVVESVIGLQSYMLARNRVTVDLDIPPELPLLSVDRSQLQQVLVNLTVNAAQAIHEAGRPGRIAICASAIQRDGAPFVRIEVADDGPGVPAAVADRLFVPFVTTKPPGSGTGLGLSVSFGIVAAHGGTINHEPSPNGGATFVIELPVSAGVAAGAALEADRTARARPDTSAGAELDATSPRGARILVLDDEASIRDFLARILRRAGYEPVPAATGAEALEIIRRAPPAAILCDHRMAGMDGIAFEAEAVRIRPELAGRLAFMSGDVLNPDLREVAEARGIPLLAKPFDIASVDGVIRSLLDGRGSGRPETGGQEAGAPSAGG
jgi:two-component system NtrC family sensor kinase